jgi:calcineurin-like phosphoesterase family protein
MIDTWIGADFHFYHETILEYSKDIRKFANIEEHNAQLIQNWNSVVKPNDKMIVVGDFFVGECTEEQIDEVMKQLNGEIELIEGNHDSKFKKKILSKYVKNITATKVLRENKCHTIIQHIPVHPQQVEHRFKANIHGHTHSHIITKKEYFIDSSFGYVNSREVPDPRYINVSLEQINLTPTHMDIIRQRIRDIT